MVHVASQRAGDPEREGDATGRARRHRGGTTELLERAACGDDSAWDALVVGYGRLIWAVTHAHHFDEHDANDVFQSTWLRLLEHLDSIEEPEALAGWLSTTARREALRLLASRGRVVLTEDPSELEPAAAYGGPEPDAPVLLAELQADVQRALTRLPSRYRQLAELLMLDPPMHYREIARTLDMPVGSIGPSRGRCLRMLRDLVEIQCLDGSGGPQFDLDRPATTRQKATSRAYQNKSGASL